MNDMINTEFNVTGVFIRRMLTTTATTKLLGVLKLREQIKDRKKVELQVRERINKENLLAPGCWTSFLQEK